MKPAFTFSDPGIVEFFGDQLTETIGDGIDLLFCNEHEAMQYTGKDNVTDAIEVIKTFSKNFAITLGSEGAAVYDGTTLYDIAAHDVKAVDTNGAGDNFAGAFLYGITHGMNYQQAGDLASKTAAQVITDFGPRLTPDEYRKLVQG